MFQLPTNGLPFEPHGVCVSLFAGVHGETHPGGSLQVRFRGNYHGAWGMQDNAETAATSN